MSHFSVAVVMKNRNDLDKILEPYSECLEVEPYISKTKEQIIQEAKKWQKNLQIKKKTGFDKEYMDKYINAKTDEELYQIEVDDYCQYDENGNELSTYNPNSKWDWYSIGGRFTGSLLTKNENTDIFEVDGYEELFDELFGRRKNIEKKVIGYKIVDGAKIKDIEFNKMKEINNDVFYTWALVDENGWYEQGEMGWWALNNATDESTKEFSEMFQEYIKAPKNQDKYMVIVDCHI